MVDGRPISSAEKGDEEWVRSAGQVSFNAVQSAEHNADPSRLSEPSPLTR